MAINNKDLVLFEEITEVNDIREMGELEIAGAIAYVYCSIREYQMINFGECWEDFNSVNNRAYYCGKRIQLNDNQGYVVDYKDGKELVIDHVFMRENSVDTLWGFAYWYDPEAQEESEMFLVRI
jgi:hypothetical protein